MPAFDHPLLDLKRMEMLRKIRLVPHGSVEGAYAGQHKSHYRGTAVEFADFREYTPGDDIRILDWKVFARTDRYYVRQYEAERNLLTYFAVDASGSMSFDGVLKKTPSKFSYASCMAAALAYTVVREGDETGLTVANEQKNAALPVRGGWTHLSHFAHTLSSTQPSGTTCIGSCLQELYRRAKRRGTLIIMSDFLSLDDVFWKSIDLFRKSRFDVMLFQVTHPEELSLPDVAMGRFVGTEGEPHHFDMAPNEVADAYRTAFENHVRQVEAHAAHRGCSWFQPRTDADPYLFLKQCLLAKERSR